MDEADSSKKRQAESPVGTLAGLKELLESQELEVSMFAVMKTHGNSKMELRALDVDQNQSTESFDRRLLGSGLSTFLDEGARYEAFEEALDLRSVIGILPLEEISETYEKDPDVAKPTLLEFVESIQNVQKDFLDDTIPYLSKEEFTKVAGVLFVYACPELSNPVYAYQKVPPSATMEQSSFLYRLGGGSKFRLFTDESIKIGPSFDFLILENMILAAKLSTITSQFSYGTILRKRAKDAIDELSSLLNGTDFLSIRVSKNRKRTINKLLKIKKSPVLSMPPSELRSRLEKEELYRGKFQFDSDDKVIVREENVDEILKMLNDELLRSPLTNTVYESEIKSMYEAATI